MKCFPIWHYIVLSFASIVHATLFRAMAISSSSSMSVKHKELDALLLKAKMLATPSPMNLRSHPECCNNFATVFLWEKSFPLFDSLRLWTSTEFHMRALSVFISRVAARNALSTTTSFCNASAFLPAEVKLLGDTKLMKQPFWYLILAEYRLLTDFSHHVLVHPWKHHKCQLHFAWMSFAPYKQEYCKVQPRRGTAVYIWWLSFGMW